MKRPLTVATFLSWGICHRNTERGGFEPPKAFDLTRLPIVHLRPLGHLSSRESKASLY